MKPLLNNTYLAKNHYTFIAKRFYNVTNKQDHVVSHYYQMLLIF